MLALHPVERVEQSGVIVGAAQNNVARTTRSEPNCGTWVVLGQPLTDRPIADRSKQRDRHAGGPFSTPDPRSTSLAGLDICGGPAVGYLAQCSVNVVGRYEMQVLAPQQRAQMAF